MTPFEKYSNNYIERKDLVYGKITGSVQKNEEKVSSLDKGNYVDLKISNSIKDFTLVGIPKGMEQTILNDFYNKDFKSYLLSDSLYVYRGNASNTNLLAFGKKVGNFQLSEAKVKIIKNNTGLVDLKIDSNLGSVIIEKVPVSKSQKILDEYYELGSSTFFGTDRYRYAGLGIGEVHNKTKEELSKTEMQLTGKNLDDIGVSRSEALQLATKVLNISQPLNFEEYKKEIKKYQDSHNIGIDGKIGKETFIEMKAGIVLEKAKKGNNILPATQKEVLYILNNGNPLGENIRDMYKFLCNFRKKPTGNNDYKDFFGKLDYFFKNGNSYTKKIEKDIKSGKGKNGTIYQRGKEIWMNDNLTDKQKLKATYDEFKGGAKILLGIAFLFGMFGTGTKATNSWWKRALVLFGIGYTGVLEAGDDLVDLAFEGGNSDETVLETGVRWSTGIGDWVKEKTGNTETVAKKSFLKGKGKLKEKNIEKGDEKLEDKKFGKLFDVFSGNKDLLNKRIVELRGVNDIKGTFFTDSEKKELSNAGIDNKDLKKFITLLQDVKKGDNQTLIEYFTSFVPEKTKVEKSIDEIKEIKINNFTSIDLIDKQIEKLKNQHKKLKEDTSIPINDLASYVKEYENIRLKLVEKGAKIEKSKGEDGKYTKEFTKNKLLKDLIDSKIKIKENNIKIEKSIKEINEFEGESNEKLEFYIKKLENLKKLISENTKELIKYKKINDNSEVERLTNIHTEHNNKLAAFSEGELKNTLKSYFTELKTKETEISSLGLSNLEDIPKIKSYLEARKSDVYTKLAKDLGLEKKEIKASDLLVKLKEKKTEILETKVSKLPILMNQLKLLKSELTPIASTTLLTVEELEEQKIDKNIITSIDQIISSNIKLSDIKKILTLKLNDTGISNSTKEGMSHILKYYNNLK